MLLLNEIKGAAACNTFKYFHHWQYNQETCKAFDNSKQKKAWKQIHALLIGTGAQRGATILAFISRGEME